MWKDFIDSFGDDCQQDFHRNRAATDGSKGSAEVDLRSTADDVPCVNTTGNGDDCTNGNVHANIEIALRLTPNETSNESETGSKLRGESTNSVTFAKQGPTNQGSSVSNTRALSLRQWIKYATNSGSNGYSSPMYTTDNN